MFDNNGGMIGEILETGQNTAKSVGDAAKQGVKSTVSSTVSQVTGKGSGGTNEAASASAQQQNMSDDQAKDFLKGLYGKSDAGNKPSSPKQQQQQGSGFKQALGIKPKDPNAGKTPQEVADMQKLRMQLHSETYYQPLVNPPKQKEEPVTEKLEKEKQMEAIEEQKKLEKKPGPLQNVKTGTGEKMVGASG